MWDVLVRLYNDLLNDEARDVEHDLLVPAAVRLAAFAPVFDCYRSLTTAPPPAPAEDLWTWYALSRVHDLLILGLQPHPHDHDRLSDWFMPGLTLRAEVRFLRMLGLEPTGCDRFTPFFHEIVEVIEDPARDAPVVDEVLWPALRFGHMLFSRAGVRVRCPPGTLDPHLAAKTTLYFARRRR